MTQSSQAALEKGFVLTDTGAIRAGEERAYPLNKLKRSPENVRKGGHSEAVIEQRAASILAKGLIHLPVVKPERRPDGSETGYALVTAGEGRRVALRRLAPRTLIPKTALIRCLVDEANDAVEVSLDENISRNPLHPADEFEAFFDLSERQGRGAEEIAARFGVTAAVVRQRLRLAAVAPDLIARYRDEELTLDQLMAFAVDRFDVDAERVLPQLLGTAGSLGGEGQDAGPALGGDQGAVLIASLDPGDPEAVGRGADDAGDLDRDLDLADQAERVIGLGVGVQRPSALGIGEVVGPQPVLAHHDWIGRHRPHLLDEPLQPGGDHRVRRTKRRVGGAHHPNLAELVDLHDPGRDLAARALPDEAARQGRDGGRLEQGQQPHPSSRHRDLSDAVIPLLPRTAIRRVGLGRVAVANLGASEHQSRPSERSTDAPPPPWPEDAAWAAAEAPWLTAWPCFMR